jgi:2-polyprenyl-3-methyl-5-hydroxy-6-metoxy-1,4-benzoquinol methylase
MSQIPAPPTTTRVVDEPPPGIDPVEGVAVATQSPDELVERLFGAVLGAMDVFAVYLGDKLGFYRALDEDGPATSDELARTTGTAERYVREWLEQQAITGILICDDPTAAPSDRHYRLPEGYGTVLVDPDSLTAMAPLAQVFVGCVKPLPHLLEAFRTGGGVSYEDYGVDLREGQAGTTRPQFRHLLAQEWLPAMPDIHRRLQAYSAARVADIGFGLGWSSIAIANAYPNVRVDGFDLDEASVRAARANAEVAGVAERVTFHHRDAGDPDLAGRYDFALAVECIHDMPNPVAVLSAMRRLVGDGGTVLIVDEKVADRFMAPGDDIERMMYGWSILHCLPVGMSEQPSAATGTVIREPTLRHYAEDAGFREVAMLPIEHDFFRFYRLTG